MARKEPTDPRVNKWIERRSIGERVQTPIYQKTRKYWDLFFAVVKNISSPWRSRLFLPEYFSIIWAKAAILTGRPISFDVVAHQPEDEVAAQVMKQVMDFQLREPNAQPSFYKNYTTMVIESLVTGTAFAEVNFMMKPRKFINYLRKDDGTLDFSKQEVVKRMARWCEINPIEQTRIFFDPAATHPQKAAWIVVEDFRTKEAILAKASQDKSFYTNLDKLDDAPQASDDLGFHNASRNKLFNLVDKINEDPSVKYIKIWKCYERKLDTKTGEEYIEYSEIAGELTLIREPRRLQHWHNMYPIAVMYDYDRPHELWGIGEIEATESLVRGMNDNLNHFMDNQNLSNNTMIMRKSSTILEPFIIEPGGEVIYDGERPEQFRWPSPDGQSFQLVQGTLQAGLERASGIGGYLNGAPSSSVDKTRGTKGGIERIIQSGQNRISYSQRQIGDFMEQVGRMYMSYIQQYFTEEFVIRLTDGPYQRVAPEDIQGEFDVFIQDTSLDPVSKAEEVDMILGMIERLEKVMPILQMEGKSIAMSSLLTRYLTKLGEKQPENIIIDMPPPQPAKQEIKKNISIAFSGDMLPPQLQAELLAEQFEAEDEEEAMANNGILEGQDMNSLSGLPTTLEGFNGDGETPIA